MLQGLYAAASGMEAQQTQLDATANDLANISTPGYQSTVVGFSDLLYSGAGAASGSPVATGTGATAAIIGRDGTEGALKNTGRPLDVAVDGPGYIEVRRPDGSVGLTRDGALALDARGRLVTTTGLPLNPPVTVPAGTKPEAVAIAADGTVSVGGRRAGRINLVTVPAPGGLLAAGQSVYTPSAASGTPRAARGTTVTQGALEQSNVDMAAAMSGMITAQRSYQLASQAIQYQDQMLQIANQVKK